MKKISIFSVKAILILFLCAALLPACNKNETSSADALDKDTSYAFGMVLATYMMQMGLPALRYDYQAFMEGFRDFNEAKETRLSLEKADEKITAALMRLQSQMDEDMWLEGEKNREEGAAYLAENGRRSGVTTTASGLQYEVITQGSGAKPGPYDRIRVHYEGTFTDGEIFDSSYWYNEPAEFFVGQVISGWQEGLQLMSVGSTYRFVIPSDLAYGPGGMGIPPNAVLIFKVELLAIVE